ncbi:MAG: Asp-tRNA(Asn)/Glu-tRNA(Gln) amidotransferase subunit GatB [Acidimicrobiia bacterium]|nr:Asp-tRNA(Asn)/Glu-tRNA(Gln) amidotransferase subunit GatB [Acidimicrobiia bacterium]
MTEYEAVIGIETHVELQTNSKMFCGCAVDFNAEANTVVCPVCLALPGALPVPNASAIDGILSIGAALSCELVEHSLFHRKNYFYPDLPKNYQISQYDVPLCADGHIDIVADGEPFRIGITRVHMEEDTGKSTHIGDDGRIRAASHSLLDFNRAGVPLVEIVTEPDIRTAEQARVYGAELQMIVRTLGVSDARLEEGSMRFDVNVSLRPVGQEEFGTRTEVKNVNSLRSMYRAIEFEIARQTEVLDSGGTIVQETRHWNEDSQRTTSMRSKEDSEDYRYFQEPDLLPLHIDAAWSARVYAAIPELPAIRRSRYLETGIDMVTAGVMVADAGLGELFDAAVASGADPKQAANWITGEVVANLRRTERQLADLPLSAEHLTQLDEMVSAGSLSATAAKDVLGGVMDGEGSPEQVAQSRDLLQISDTGALTTEVNTVLADNEDAVDKMRSGDMKPLGFLVGQVMKATGGKADPRMVSELIRNSVKE